MRKLTAIDFCHLVEKYLLKIIFFFLTFKQQKAYKRYKKSFKQVARKFKKTIKITKKSGVIFSSNLFEEIKGLYLISKEQWQEIVTPIVPKKTKRKKYRKKKLKKNKFKEFTNSLAFKTTLSFILSTLLVLSTLFVYDYLFKDLPSAHDLILHQPEVSSKILDRNGVLLYSIYEDENRTIVPLEKISPFLIQATIAIEDQNFYEHPGFDIQGISRALIGNLKGERVEGGSTITQQLVKNTLLTKERTLKRKLREILVSILVDASFSKDEILEKYLNQVPYGGSTYGIEEAARRYFGKHASELNLAEGSMLAGLPQAPTLYSPFGPHPERAKLRQAQVLERMVSEGYITAEQAAQAKNEELNFKANINNIKAPHFVFYVKEILAQKYGEEMVSSGGLIVKTTLDYSLQEQAEKILSQELERLKNLKVNNGAALITNPQTGEVLTMIGSKNYFDFENDGQVNVTLRPRQPGSSIKPITYALALESGKTPSSIIDDSPITYHIAGSKPYSPVNYDGKYHGKVTLRTALANSYNIPAVKTLAEVGVNKMIDKAEAMGITTWENRKRFGLSLTLGGGDVRMIDMTQVYGSLANLGMKVDINPFLEIKTYEGETLYENDCVKNNVCQQEKVLEPAIAWQITDILKDNLARSAAFGTQSVLNIPGQEVAVKTGTTNNLRDNWTLGYTSDRVVATWVGNNDNSPMSYVASGITGASPIWNSLIKLTLDDNDPHRFASPSGLVKIKICQATGTLPCSACPWVVEEWFVLGTEPKFSCEGWNWQKKEE